MKIKSYRDLEAYKKGCQLTKVIYGMTREFPKEEIYSMTASKDIGFCKETSFKTAYELNLEIIKLLKTYINKLTTLYPLYASFTKPYTLSATR